MERELDRLCEFKPNHLNKVGDTITASIHCGGNITCNVQALVVELTERGYRVQYLDGRKKRLRHITEKDIVR